MARFSLRWLILIAFLGVLSIVVGVGYVSYREQDDTFCISCHTQPETDYFNRNVQAVQNQSASDLASFHYRKKETRCIDCHVGEGLTGRGIVVSLAAWDAFKHYTGIARQPAQIVFSIQNEGCLKCHIDDVRKPGFENHMHNKYYDPQLSPPFIRCTDCHPVHRQSTEDRAFQFRDVILPKCEYCHVQVGKGPRGLAR